MENLSSQIPPEMKLVQLNPATLKTDAKTYQFRSNGDANGVTASIRIEATSWNPETHGRPILVYERLDGSRYVVDGHHRLDFAKRLRAQGKGPERINAYLMREADGYTAKDARIIAAFRNMEQGNASAVESARVFKEASSAEVHQAWLPSLQMDKSNLRMAYTMSGLSDQALETVEKHEIPDSVAARVAASLHDARSQDTLIGFIGFMADTIKQAYTTPPESDYDIHVHLGAQGHAARLMRQRAIATAGRAI